MAKPGIIYGNLITGSAGFFLATKTHLLLELYIETIIGLGLVIGSACVFNNYIDKDIDRKMSRTKKRALVTGDISKNAAIIYASFLGLTGYAILIAFTNWLTVLATFVAQFFYIVIYGWAKRNTIYSTLIGSIPGALPPVIGYVAFKNQLDSAAILLFLIVATWQIPHFYAIGIFRRKEYEAAGLPILPVVKGKKIARRHIISYILIFFIFSELLYVYGYTGITYLVAVLILGGYWLVWGVRKYHLPDKVWGKKMFFLSLIANLGISLFIAIGARLP